jgi:hypothetical protein
VIAAPLGPKADFNIEIDAAIFYVLQPLLSVPFSGGSIRT